MNKGQFCNFAGEPLNPTGHKWEVVYVDDVRAEIWADGIMICMCTRVWGHGHAHANARHIVAMHNREVDDPKCST